MRMKIQEATPLTGLREGTCSSAAKAASTHERLLVAQAKSGRSSAFGELYELHRVRIYHTAFRILRNRQDAEDAVQRSFQRAFTNLCRFREDSTFSTWVTRVAINDALMLLRQRRANTRLLENNDDAEAPSVVDSAAPCLCRNVGRQRSGREFGRTAGFNCMGAFCSGGPESRWRRCPLCISVPQLCRLADRSCRCERPRTGSGTVWREAARTHAALP